MLSAWTCFRMVIYHGNLIKPWDLKIFGPVNCHVSERVGYAKDVQSAAAHHQLHLTFRDFSDFAEAEPKFWCHPTSVRGMAQGSQSWSYLKEETVWIYGLYPCTGEHNSVDRQLFIHGCEWAFFIVRKINLFHEIQTLVFNFRKILIISPCWSFPLSPG